jgi:hypothetical protein
MIVVRLFGGLGNQLFQYATARALATSCGAELAIDCSWFASHHDKVTPRTYEMFHYSIAARAASKRDLPIPVLYSHKVLKRLPLLRRLKLVREKNFRFDPEILALSDNVYLDGYWQSPKYFAGVRDHLLGELVPKEPMSELDRIVAHQIASTKSVSIHVRRGDYVTLASAAQTHGVCSLDYYRSAVASVQERVQNTTFFVFSDDPKWTKANLHFDSPTVYVTHNGPDSAFQDLRLMSLCENQIVANSSFSWWGAWLNKNPEKLVFAPATWFADERIDTKDLCPPSWIKI